MSCKKKSFLFRNSVNSTLNSFNFNDESSPLKEIKGNLILQQMSMNDNNKGELERRFTHLKLKNVLYHSR